MSKDKCRSVLSGKMEAILLVSVPLLGSCSLIAPLGISSIHCFIMAPKRLIIALFSVDLTTVFKAFTYR